MNVHFLEEKKPKKASCEASMPADSCRERLVPENLAIWKFQKSFKNFKTFWK